MPWNVWLPIVLLVLALVATYLAVRGRDRRQDAPRNETPTPDPVRRPDIGEGARRPVFNPGHQFPNADPETTLQAQEAGQLIAWCAQHPTTAEAARHLDGRLRALSTEWKDTPEHLRALSRVRYYDQTSSIL